MPCRDQMAKRFSAQDTQSEDNVKPPGHTHTASGRGSESAYEPESTRWSYFTLDNSGKHRWGALHTHLPMFWDQSGVEHQSWQQLLLHAHNNLTAIIIIMGKFTGRYFLKTIYKISTRPWVQDESSKFLKQFSGSEKLKNTDWTFIFGHWLSLYW